MALWNIKERKACGVAGAVPTKPSILTISIFSIGKKPMFL